MDSVASHAPFRVMKMGANQFAEECENSNDGSHLVVGGTRRHERPVIPAHSE